MRNDVDSIVRLKTRRSPGTRTLRTTNMGHEYFFAQDQAGNTHKVHVNRRQSIDSGSGPDLAQAPWGYALDDGSRVRRIDNDTFQVAGTGAVVTIVRE